LQAAWVEGVKARREKRWFFTGEKSEEFEKQQGTP
jgi:hypothetical protein